VINYFLPVVFMTACMTLWRGFKVPKNKLWRVWLYALALLLTGVSMDLGVLWFTAQEGSLLGYALVCLGMALVHWIWTHPWGQTQ
jgi:hypothetical protein